MDPELGINVVDLGLVYGVTLGGDGVATIDMTLIQRRVPADGRHRGAGRLRAGGPGHRLPHQLGVAAPWGPDKITEDGRG